MGCGGAKRAAPNQVVQIGVARQTVKANPRPSPTPVKVGDFHCGKCGLSLRKRSERYFHNCPGPRSIPYQESRREKCNECVYNLDGICVEYKRRHPDRDAVIDIGVRMAFAGCPINRWEKTQRECPACTRTLFDPSGVHACHYCGWAEDSKARMKSGWATIPVMRDEPDPQSKFAIVTVVIGLQAEELAYKTIPAMKRYAEMCGADLIVIRDDQSPEYVLGNKFRVGTYVAAYERTLFLDVDVYVRDETPNLFETYPPGSVYMHNDRPFLRDENWLRGESYALAQSQNVPLQELTCLNTGVVLCDREHALIWRQLPEPFRATHTSEQSWVEVTTRSSKVNVVELPTPLNTQWWFPDFQERSAEAMLVHLASCPHYERLFLLDLLVAGDREMPKSKTKK